MIQSSRLSRRNLSRIHRYIQKSGTQRLFATLFGWGLLGGSGLLSGSGLLARLRHVPAVALVRGAATDSSVTFPFTTCNGWVINLLLRELSDQDEALAAVRAGKVTLGEQALLEPVVVAGDNLPGLVLVEAADEVVEEALGGAGLKAEAVVVAEGVGGSGAGDVEKSCR